MAYITDTEQLCIEEGIERGIEQGQAELVCTMHQHGMSIEEIAEVTELDVAKIERIVLEGGEPSSAS